MGEVGGTRLCVCVVCVCGGGGGGGSAECGCVRLLQATGTLSKRDNPARQLDRKSQLQTVQNDALCVVLILR